jgi:hypothetical protein
MNTNLKVLMRTAAVLLAAGSIAAVAMRQNEISSLRAEQQALLNDSQEAERLALENQDIEKLRADNAEVAKLRLENKDLPKLRNQVRQLRKQVDEMAKLKADNERLANQPTDAPQPGQQVSGAKNQFAKESLRDVGMGAPVMTLQTYFAALSQGNMNRAMECLTPEAAAKLASDATNHNAQQLLESMNNFNGYEIIGRNQPSADEIDLEVKLNITGASAGPGNSEPGNFRFKLIDNQWKMFE